jgi:hypothetical protein
LTCSKVCGRMTGMKHCLKQREKNQQKFTFVTIGLDGPWEKGEVTIRFHPKNKRVKSHYTNYSQISLWGEDDFGMEKVNASEEDFHNLVNICKKAAGFIPTIDVLRKMGFVFC